MIVVPASRLSPPLARSARSQLRQAPPIPARSSSHWSPGPPARSGLASTDRPSPSAGHRWPRDHRPGRRHPRRLLLVRLPEQPRRGGQRRRLQLRPTGHLLGRLRHPRPSAQPTTAFLGGSFSATCGPGSSSDLAAAFRLLPVQRLSSTSCLRPAAFDR